MQVTLQVVEQHAAGVVDQVNAYFGMRKIEVARDFKGAPRIMLNGKVELNIGMLDQGFWPDGLYTAPSGQQNSILVAVLQWDSCLSFPV